MIEYQEESGKHDQVISGLLQDKIEERLINKEQVLLLQNRRGFSPVIRCGDCGSIRNYRRNAELYLCQITILLFFNFVEKFKFSMHSFWSLLKTSFVNVSAISWCGHGARSTLVCKHLSTKFLPSLILVY